MIVMVWSVLLINGCSGLQADDEYTRLIQASIAFSQNMEMRGARQELTLANYQRILNINTKLWKNIGAGLEGVPLLIDDTNKIDPSTMRLLMGERKIIE